MGFDEFSIISDSTTMNSEHYCNVFVEVLDDGHFVSLGQLSLTMRIREVADRVLDMKKWEGLQNLCLGYLVPPEIIVYLLPETTLSEAKSYIMRVSYALIMVGLQLLAN